MQIVSDIFTQTLVNPITGEERRVAKFVKLAVFHRSGNKHTNQFCWCEPFIREATPSEIETTKRPPHQPSPWNER